MTMIRDDKELETLAQEVSFLKNNTQLAHDEEKKIENKLFSLCNKTYKYIFKDDKMQDYLLFYDAFEEIIKGYNHNSKESFTELIKKRYRLKCRGKKAERLEDTNHAESKLREAHIRKALREKAIENGMDSKNITNELKKFNLLNKQRVHDFLINKCYFDEIELNDFDEKYFNTRWTIQLDEQCDEKAQNTANNEAANHNMTSFIEKTSFDQVLDITYDYSVEQGEKTKLNMQGYWSIRFVEGYISKKRAEEKEKHIIKEFFLDNIHLYKRYKDRIFKNYKYENDCLTIAQLEKIHNNLHSKVVRELHRDLMPKMSVELKLQPDTWRKTYKNINSYVWCVINDLHIFRE